MKFTYGGIDCEGSPLEALEFKGLVDASQKPLPTPGADPVVPAAAVPPAPSAAKRPEEDRRSWVGSKLPRPWLPTAPSDSLYYSVARIRNHALIAQLYEYVASFPEGVTAKQCAEVFRNSTANVQTQLASLGADNLVMKIGPRRYGKIYRATYPHGLAAAVEDAVADDAAGLPEEAVAT